MKARVWIVEIFAPGGKWMPLISMCRHTRQDARDQRRWARFCGYQTRLRIRAYVREEVRP